MSDKPNPRQILEDLSNELKGSLIEDTFEVQGIKWTMRLLNDDEISWSFSKTDLDPKNAIAMGISFRTPTLAIGIRRINDTSVLETFKSDWDALTEGEKEDLLNKNGQTQEKIAAELLWRYLKVQTSEFIKELWDHWQSLEERRKEVQDSLKKSLTGDGEVGEKKNSASSTPDGK